MTDFRSPPPPLAPPPSRETDIVFGALLTATGILTFLFFGYLILCGPFGIYGRSRGREDKTGPGGGAGGDTGEGTDAAPRRSLLPLRD